MAVTPGAKRAALLLGSTLIVLSVGEVALRLGGYQPFQGLFDGREFLLQEPSYPGVFYELKANCG